MSSKPETEQELISSIANIQSEALKIDIIMSQRNCFRPDEDSDLYPIIQSYLHTSASAQETSTRLLSPTGSNPFLSDLSFSIIHSAKRLPFRDTPNLHKLVALMSAMKDQPTLFHNLGGFTGDARESINDVPGCGSGYLLPEAHAYANAQYLFALLTLAQVADFWVYCVWSMQRALETEHKDDGLDGGWKTGSAVDKYNAAVLAAGVWIFAAGQEVFERGEEEEEEDATPTYSGKSLWNAGAGFSKARWKFWKRQFSDVAGMQELTEEVRSVAREAAEKMDKVEREL